MKCKVLVTGGAGFIGSHTLVHLLKAGYAPFVLDNLCNSVQIEPGQTKPMSILRAETLAQAACGFDKVDLLDVDGLNNIFTIHGPFAAVIHFAGLKSVGESVAAPFKYYQNNVVGTVNLIQAMINFGVKKLIFSSSSTVYGQPQYLPLDEKHPTGNCISPNGKTKAVIEQMLLDVCNSDPEWTAVCLRYFNPIGAHPSGDIGEAPFLGIRNLIPAISQIAIGRKECLKIFGNDYETRDGTAIRGYIHVEDVAAGHVKAMEKLLEGCIMGWKAYNLGTSIGWTVLDILKAYEKASGKSIPYEFVGRRAGDIGTTCSDCTLARLELGWEAKLDLAQMCEDSWRWQQKNPNGYSQF